MIEFLPFRLDLVNQCLWRRHETGTDERILLPPKAFEVLRYLVEHPGRLVTEAELLSAVWPKTYVQPEVIKSQLYEIRKILGDNAKSPLYIETLPRRGYQFIAQTHAHSAAVLPPIWEPTRSKFVDRDSALADLRTWLREAARGRRQMVFITGEPGIGKTALVDEFQRQGVVDVPGIRVARGQCIEGYGGKEPYYPMLDALGQMGRESTLPSIVGTLATCAPTWLVQFPALIRPEQRASLEREILGTTSQRMVREIVTALETIADTAPLLLIFEDLQWVDQATVDLVSALARRRTPARLMLVGTTRPVDPVPQENSLLALQRDLQIHGLCHGVDLEPLDHPYVAELLAAGASRETLPSGFSDLIHRRSGGNPLFIEAALDHFLQRGFLSRNSGTWKIEVPLASMEREVPENLRQMIDAQISRLSKEEQHALEAASIVGTAFSTSTAAEALDTSAKGLDDVYDELSRRRRFVRPIGSLRWPDGSRTSRYEFTHSFYPEVLYQRQSRGRRTLLHRRIGGHLEDRLGANAPEAASELANHFDHGADCVRAVKYWRLAADTAVRRYAPREAAQLLERAFDLTDSLPVAQRDHQRVGILQTLAPLHVAAADMRAIDIYERLAETAARCGALDVQVQAQVDLGFFLSWMSAERAIAELNAALKLSEKQTSLMRSRTRMSCLFWRSWIRGWDAADVERCRGALAEIRAEGDSPALAPHLMEYSFIQWASSEYRPACHAAEESVAIVLTEGHKNPYVDLVYLLGRIIIPWSLLFAGEWGRALRETADAIEIMEKNQALHRIGSLRLIDAWIRLEGMDFLGARTICESMLALTQNPENAGRSPQLRICLILAGSAAAALGETDQALEHLRAAAQAMDREMVIHDWYWRMLLESAFAETWLVRGDLVKAKSHAERYLAAALETAERTWQTRAWESVARIALAEGDLPRARDRLSNALAAMKGFEVPLAEWRVHGTAAELEQLSQDTGAAEHHRELSRAAILKIAHSLGPSEPLRAIFLSAPPVVHLLGGPVAG